MYYFLIIITELKEKTINDWEKDEKTFVNTKAAMHVDIEVNKNKLTVITGPPGSGKMFF